MVLRVYMLLVYTTAGEHRQGIYEEEGQLRCCQCAAPDATLTVAPMSYRSCLTESRLPKPQDRLKCALV